MPSKALPPASGSGLGCTPDLQHTATTKTERRADANGRHRSRQENPNIILALGENEAAQ
jgi:hypothetical protein